MSEEEKIPRVQASDKQYLGIGEILSYSFGSSGVNGIGSLVMLTSLSATTILMGSVYQMSPLLMYIMTSIITFISLIKTPIISEIMDNTKHEKGKFKPYLIWMGIPSMIFVAVLPFVPLSWIDIQLFTIFSEPFSLAALMIFILQILLSITWPTFLVANTGLGQVITPNTLERAKMFSFQSILASLWPSIVTIGFPLLSILTKQGNATGQQNILSYRVWFPIYALASFLFSLFSYFNCKERIIVEKNYKPKIKFKHGMKSLGSNKYFWIATFSGVFGMIRVAGNLQNWINVYSLKSDIATSISTTLLGNAMVPGMLLTSFMVRKFGKRNLMIVTGFGSAVLYIPMIIFPQFPIFLLSMIFLQNMLAGFGICAQIMPADALDYQQLKTGERLEGFWGMFNQLVLAVFWLGGGLIGPAVLEVSGMTREADFLLPINRIRYTVFRNFSIVSGIACFFQTIPFLFWDLTEEKHKEIINQLKLIAQQKNGISKIS